MAERVTDKGKERLARQAVKHPAPGERGEGQTTEDDGVFAGLGRRIREERTRLGMTQEQFGALGGVRRATQILYEQGSTRPSLTYIGRVAAAGTDHRYLLFGERAGRRHCSIHLNLIVMEKAMALADRLSRDDRGRLFDPEVRHTVLKQLLLAVSEKTEDEIDWDSLQTQQGRVPDA